MQELLKKKIAEALGVHLEQVSITVPEVAEFGHYSTNVAMRLAKETKKAPLELAQIFATTLLAADEGKMFSKIEAVKPGFINFWLSEKFLAEQFTKKLEQPNVGKGEVVVVDYAACNIAKPMHVGHLRSTIIGDALANIHEYLGYKAIRWDYLGDWGTQFGKLIYAYKHPLNVAAKGITKENLDARIKEKPIDTLLDLYVGYHEYIQGVSSNEGAEIENGARAEFKKLEDGDAENRKLWEWFKDESIVVFHKLFKRLDVKFDLEIGESFYEEAIYDVLKELGEKQLLVPGEDGSRIVNLDQFKLPVALIQKSDGASLYITRDIASMEHRLSRYKPVKLLYVVANQQALHFEQLFAIAKLLGHADKAELQHIKFGMVLGEDGKKFATREGKLIKLEDLIDEVVAKAATAVKNGNPEMNEAEVAEIAEIVGIGALKYGDLKENRNSDIIFDWERLLDLHGDTAPYLQYTAVRLMNIVRKAGEQGSADTTALVLPMEVAIMKKVLDFSDIVRLCAETYYTSHLAKYLIELAKLANQYYESERILDDADAKRKGARVLLVARVSETLAQGLNLLGIQVPERI
jgi:arginyl-tRNA synthetase